MNPQTEHEILELASLICDQAASTEQIAQLESLLTDDASAREIYANYMLLHGELFWQQATLLESVVLPPHIGRRNTIKSKFSWLLALAAVIFVMAIGGVYLNYFGGPNRHASMASRGTKVATITGTRNSRWSIIENGETVDGPIGFGSNLYAGQKLELLEGLAEITLVTGVRMIVEAPCQFDLSSKAESVLHSGRMTASVPEGAEGFKVACEGLTLVDRGTEFGVSAEEGGETELHVFAGLVDGYVRDNMGSPFKKVSWKTNDTVLFNSATREFRDVKQPSRFIRSLAESPPVNKGLFATEDFEYAVGPLGGNSGGFGWGGPWEDISVAQNLPRSNGVGQGSIWLTGSEQIGNHALLSGQFNRIRRKLGMSFAGIFDTAMLVENQDGSRLIGRDGATIYLSFVQQVSLAGDGFYALELHRGDGNRNRVLCLGHGAAKRWLEGPPRSPDKAAGLTGWSVTSEFNGSENQLLEIGELGAESTEPVMIVVKIVFGPDNQDEVFVFVNPDRDSEANALVHGKGNFAFDRIGIANFDGDKDFQVDQIRIGATFSSVLNPIRVPVSLEQH